MREGRICKIFLEWNNPWWTSESTPINLGQNYRLFVLLMIVFTSAWSREEVEEATEEDWWKTIFSLSPVEGQARLLVCWVVGRAAVVADSLEDGQIIQQVTELLRTFTGDPDIPPPDQVIRSEQGEEEEEEEE